MGCCGPGERRRQLISSTPAKRSGSNSAATTHSTTRPTVHHDIRHSRATALLPPWWPGQQVVEVSAQVSTGMGDGTASTTTPWAVGAVQVTEVGSQFQRQIQVVPARGTGRVPW